MRSIPRANVPRIGCIYSSTGLSGLSVHEEHPTGLGTSEWRTFLSPQKCYVNFTGYPSIWSIGSSAAKQTSQHWKQYHFINLLKAMQCWLGPMSPCSVTRPHVWRHVKHSTNTLFKFYVNKLKLQNFMNVFSIIAPCEISLVQNLNYFSRDHIGGNSAPHFLWQCTWIFMKLIPSEQIIDQSVQKLVEWRTVENMAFINTFWATFY